MYESVKINHENKIILSKKINFVSSLTRNLFQLGSSHHLRQHISHYKNLAVRKWNKVESRSA